MVVAMAMAGIDDREVGWCLESQLEFGRGRMLKSAGAGATTSS